MRRVFEASNVENEGKVLTDVIAAVGREVATTGLSHCNPVVRGHDDGLAAGRSGERIAPDDKRRRVAAVDVNLSAVAARQAGKLINVQTALAHLRERHATI